MFSATNDGSNLLYLPNNRSPQSFVFRLATTFISDSKVLTFTVILCVHVHGYSAQVHTVFKSVGTLRLTLSLAWNDYFFTACRYAKRMICCDNSAILISVTPGLCSSGLMYRQTVLLSTTRLTMHCLKTCELLTNTLLIGSYKKSIYLG